MRCVLGSIELDNHLWTYLFILPYPDDGTEYVPDRGEVETPNGKILWNPFRSHLRFPRPAVLHFCWNYVPGK